MDIELNTSRHLLSFQIYILNTCIHLLSFQIYIKSLVEFSNIYLPSKSHTHILDKCPVTGNACQEDCNMISTFNPKGLAIKNLRYSCSLACIISTCKVFTDTV